MPRLYLSDAIVSGVVLMAGQGPGNGPLRSNGRPTAVSPRLREGVRHPPVPIRPPSCWTSATASTPGGAGSQSGLHQVVAGSAA